MFCYKILAIDFICAVNGPVKHVEASVDVVELPVSIYEAISVYIANCSQMTPLSSPCVATLPVAI